VLPRNLQRRGEFRPAIKSICSLAGFNFLEGLDQRIAFSLREPRKSRLPRFEP
jgi:hypothetical protein